MIPGPKHTTALAWGKKTRPMMLSKWTFIVGCFSIVRSKKFLLRGPESFGQA